MFQTHYLLENKIRKNVFLALRRLILREKIMIFPGEMNKIHSSAAAAWEILRFDTVQKYEHSQKLGCALSESISTTRASFAGLDRNRPLDYGNLYKKLQFPQSWKMETNYKHRLLLLYFGSLARVDPVRLRGHIHILLHSAVSPCGHTICLPGLLPGPASLQAAWLVEWWPHAKCCFVGKFWKKCISTWF